MIADSNAIIEVGEMPVLNVYEVEIGQLFQNLISNAIKFRKKDASPKIRIDAKKIEETWQFSVSDNGIGVDPTYFLRVFDILDAYTLQVSIRDMALDLLIAKRSLSYIREKSGWNRR